MRKPTIGKFGYFIRQVVYATLVWTLCSPVFGAGVTYMRDEARASEIVTCSGDLRIFTALLRSIVEADEAHLYGEEASDFLKEENIVYIERSIGYLQARAVRYSDDAYVNELKGLLDQRSPLAIESSVLDQIVTNSVACFEMVKSEIDREVGEIEATRERRKLERNKLNSNQPTPRPWFGR